MSWIGKKTWQLLVPFLNVSFAPNFYLKLTSDMKELFGAKRTFPFWNWDHQNLSKKIRRLLGARCGAFISSGKNDVQSLSTQTITLPETSSFAVSLNLKTHPYWLKRLVSGLKVFAWDFLLSPVTSNSLSQRTGSATLTNTCPKT